MARDKDLNGYLYDIKRIQQHRVELTDEKIEAIYKQLMQDLDLFLSESYKKYSDKDGRLYMNYLDSNRAKAAFLQQIVDNVDNITPQLQRTMENMIDNVYDECYRGMLEALKNAHTSEEIHELIKDIEVDENTLKQTLENNISKLTLPAVLEEHRALIIYQIQRELTIGLLNGDRYETMAKRIEERCNVSRSKAKNITRTETHRNVESAFMECAESIQADLEGSGLVYAATWRTMKDERVRPQQRKKTAKGWTTTMRGKADHMRMEGQTVKVGEKFDLGYYNGQKVTAKAPSQSGFAAHDCNCRCFVEYNLLTLEEYKEIKNKV